MRKPLLFVWLLLPAAALAYHYGPGQERVRADRAASAATRAQDLVRSARELAAQSGDAAARGTWMEAEKEFSDALDALPSDDVAQSRTLRLERAKARMMISKLPDAHDDLEGLVDELGADSSADPKLVADARASLANAEYYTTWLMRLEGAPREEWEPEIDASRQNYKFVAEAAEKSGDAELAKESKENLEASIRLARMEVKDLQGMPLPSQ